jgi:Zn-dependent alcohol dehydrogenase
MTLYIYISSHPCITHIYIEYTVVSEISCAKIRDDAPLEKICLFGCGIRYVIQLGNIDFIIYSI